MILRILRPYWFYIIRYKKLNYKIKLILIHVSTELTIQLFNYTFTQ